MRYRQDSRKGVRKGENRMKENNSKENGKRHYTTTLFPKNSLVDATRIAKSIKENNAGNPYDRLDLAKSLGYQPESGLFRTLITSSGKFGLTSGGYSADKLSLTPLGLQVVSPTTDEEGKRSLKEALFRIPLYQGFFTKFDKNRVPREELLRNTLIRDFGIPAEDTKACYEMILKNANELGMVNNIKGTDYFQLSNLAPNGDKPEPQPPASLPEDPLRPSQEPTMPSQNPQAPSQFVPAVFVSHSKNKRILAQVKEILEFGQFNHRIAVETETTAIPIPDKVFGLMRECNCAIINVSADEGEKRDDETFGVNPNVLIEIGSAFLAYNKRVILLADRRVKLPSNLQGLAVLYYEGEELDFDTVMRLQKTLSQFRKGVAS